MGSRTRHLIISDWGEIEAPEWFVALWRENIKKFGCLPNRETDDGFLRVSFGEAARLVKDGPNRPCSH